jgi:GT2 family glycosyltransferase
MTKALTIPRTLAVVFNWCTEADSVECIASLLVDGTPGLEALIVDDASLDGSTARVAAHVHALAYLQTGENLGYAGGNLLAIE